jgi:hypothetical protein
MTSAALGISIPLSQVYVAPYDNGYYAEYDVSSFSEMWVNGGGPDTKYPASGRVT